MFQMAEYGTYNGTDLPIYRVFDAKEYNDPTIRRPFYIGEVWGVGVKGVSGKWVPTGVRWQLTGSDDECELLPAGAYAKAARMMIEAYSAKH